MYLLLDLDNTILPSKEAYTKAINGLSIDWEQRGLGSQADFLSKYEVARNSQNTIRKSFLQSFAFVML